MRITGFDDFDFEDAGYWAGIPSGWVPTITVLPQVIYRAGATATFGPSQIGEMTIPVEFGYSGSLSYELAWANLVKRLQPTNPNPRQLRAVRNDGTALRTRAVLTIPQQDGGSDVNSFQAAFVAVDPYWVADETSAAATVAGSTAVVWNPGVTGDLEIAPTYRVQPTVARVTKTANVGWEWRRRYTVTNGAAQGLTSYPWAIDLGDTSALVGGSKALASGNDLRVVVDGAEVARTLAGWNTSSTLCWVILPSLGSGQSLTLEVLYGNATAGTPPTLAYPSLPAFDLATSTNSKWVYLTDRTSGNAGKGGWYVSSGSSQPLTFDQAVPGAWGAARTLANADTATQETSSSYVASGTTYWHARFQASRGRAGSVANPNGNDGVQLSVPVGITAVKASLKFLNPESGASGSSPVGRLVVLGRASASAEWQQLYSNTTTYATETDIASTTWTPAAAVQTVAFAVWPYNGTAVDNAARSDRAAAAGWGGTLEVSVAGTALTQATAEAETAVYELATEIRQQRTGRNGGVVYTALRLGNQQGASGAGTPRLTVPLDAQVVVNAATRVPERWDSTVSTRVETLPPATARAVDGVSRAGVSSEQGAAAWLPLTPVTNPLPNPSFDAATTGWAAGTPAAGVTAGALTRDTSVYDSAPAALSLQITASTAVSGTVAQTIASSAAFSVNGRNRVWFAAAVRSTSATLQPTLTIWFYTAADALVGSAQLEADWTVPVTTWVRRVFGADVPPSGQNPAKFKVGLSLKGKAANQTGTVWLDTVTVNDNDLTLSEASGGTVVVTAAWAPRYA